jgi:glycosyltransferase involved in cell wall biosynthesis
VKIVTCCRLEYRRGIDLLLTIIPRFCEQFPYVKFVIAGDGPYRVRLEEIVRRNYLSDRVEIKVTNVESVVCFKRKDAIEQNMFIGLFFRVLFRTKIFPNYFLLAMCSLIPLLQKRFVLRSAKLLEWDSRLFHQMSEESLKESLKAYI